MKKSVFDLDFQNTSVESKIITSLERISQAFRVLLWQESMEHSLSPIQVQALIFLLHHSEEKRKVSYLAEEFNMTKATISDTIKSLEQKKLVKKEYDPGDTRSFVIHLTAKGKNIANKTALFAQQLLAPVENLHTDDKQNLLLSLIEIIRHLNNTGIITIQRMCSTCSYYQTSAGGKKHFCKLLNQEFKSTELRVDCPEHIFAEQQD
jgi:DNA-binding MarR family transcriptional regulator